MPQPWTTTQKRLHRIQLKELYIRKNLTIGEIASLLNLKEGTVYDRLIRLNIKVDKSKKLKAFNRRRINIFNEDEKLSELIGALLGDGHISDGQVWFTLGSKEQAYGDYLNQLFFGVFGYQLKSLRTKAGYLSLYLGFKELVNYLKNIGLVENKVRYQVRVPFWIRKNKKYYPACLRGLFDTDGSIYKLKNGGHQISFKNMSLPLLKDIRFMLLKLGFNPSQISNFSVYITRRGDLSKFLGVIGSKNPAKFTRLVSWVSMRSS